MTASSEITGRQSAIWSWILMARPHQWTKNAFVIAPAVFGGRITDPTQASRALMAAAIFILISSGVYAMNDSVDAPDDRASPSKRHRPVAAGHITPQHAMAGGITAMILGTALGWMLAPMVGVFCLVYVALNFAYTFRLKNIVLADVFSVSAFFVLRLLVGSAAVSVTPSVWLVLCGSLLALYLGATKRRCELAESGEDSSALRPVLAKYDIAFLDQLSTVVLSVTIVSYIMYTLTSETAGGIGESFAYSSFLVLYGLLRYQYLVHQSRTADPARIIFVDTHLILVGLAWVGYCGAVIYGVI